MHVKAIYYGQSWIQSIKSDVEASDGREHNVALNAHISIDIYIFTYFLRLHWPFRNFAVNATLLSSRGSVILAINPYEILATLE